jgi:hypothetical protein
LIVELTVKHRVLAKNFQVDTLQAVKMQQTDRFKASVSNALPGFIGLCLFFGASFTTFFIFEQTDSPVTKLSFLAVLITISLVRTASIFLNILLSPSVLDFRILPINCQTAKSMHRIMITLLAYIISAMMFSIVIYRLGAERQSVLILNLFFITLLLAVTAIMVFIYKNRVKNHILAAGYDDQQTKSWGRKQLASVWHILAILYLALLWALVVSDIATPDRHSKGAFLLSFFVVPVWMIADKVSQWIVLYAMSSLQIHQSHYDDTEEVTE